MSTCKVRGGCTPKQWVKRGGERGAVGGGTGYIIAKAKCSWEHMGLGQIVLYSEILAAVEKNATAGKDMPYLFE